MKHQIINTKIYMELKESGISETGAGEAWRPMRANVVDRGWGRMSGVLWAAGGNVADWWGGEVGLLHLFQPLDYYAVHFLFFPSYTQQILHVQNFCLK